MRKRTVLALLVSAAAAGFAAERAAMQRVRRRPDPVAQEDFSPLDDAKHHTLEMDDGGRLHVVERGEGRPLLLLHGVTLSAATWHYQLLDLADRFRVLAVDHRGHGHSTGVEGGYTTHRLAADVAAVLEQLDLEDAVIVGHSMGGMTALRFAVDFPAMLDQRVAGIVAVATTARPAPQIRAVPAVVRAVAPHANRGLSWANRLPGGYLPSNDLSYLITRVGFGSRPSPSHVELTRAMIAATEVPVMTELFTDFVEFDVTDGLGAVNVPVLVVVGDRDAVTPPYMARTIVRALPKAELVTLHGCGHMVMLERRQELNRLLVDFADGLPDHGTRPENPLA